jgi:hypothetical protein
LEGSVPIIVEIYGVPNIEKCWCIELLTKVEKVGTRTKILSINLELNIVVVVVVVVVVFVVGNTV